MTLLPVSAVVATRNRHESLNETLASLAGQSAQPREIVVVDASDGEATEALCGRAPDRLESRVRYVRASRPGAARQRNEGMRHAREDVIFFHDDDILFEPDCMARLWAALRDDEALGGVNAMIVNQRYEIPGRASRLLYRLLDDRSLPSYAGRCLGPGLNLLPEDREDLPEVVPVEWLNTTCTLYRRDALPEPPFPERFTGYSLCEDLALSLTVGRDRPLANARTARIVHKSEGGDHKADLAPLIQMSLENRHFVMTRVLRKKGWKHHLKFVAWQAFDLIAVARSNLRSLPRVALGAGRGVLAIARRGSK